MVYGGPGDMDCVAVGYSGHQVDTEDLGSSVVLIVPHRKKSHCIRDLSAQEAVHHDQRAIGAALSCRSFYMLSKPHGTFSSIICRYIESML